MAKKTKFSFGEVAEWLKAQHWKCCLGVTSTRVRIPPSPLDLVIQALQQNGLVRYLTKPFVFGMEDASVRSHIKSGNIGIIHLSYLPLCSLRSSKVKSFRCSRKRYQWEHPYFLQIYAPTLGCTHLNPYSPEKYRN